MILSKAKIYIYGILGGVVLLAGVAAFWYWNWSQEEIATLRTNNEQLKTAVERQAKTIAGLEEDGQKQFETIQRTNKKFQAARKENNKLKDKLAKHDLGYLASQKPGLVEKIVNNGTEDVGRCFELISGAEHTEEELDATKPSQINSSCPDIANPNYEAKE